jgi:hypothetical protein
MKNINCIENIGRTNKMRSEIGSGACLSTNGKAIKRLKLSFCTKGEYAKKE